LNVFFLDYDPKTCAEMHCDRHVTKMIVEYSQLMSTAHRVLDGTPIQRLSASGRKQTAYVLADNRDTTLYSATHINHPSAVWVRQNHQNYNWLYAMWCHLLDEYTHRYGKIHACARLKNALLVPPKNIPLGIFTEPTPAMPDDVKVPGNSLASYHNYYKQNKTHLAQWKNRPVPTWYTA